MVLQYKAALFLGAPNQAAQLRELTISKILSPCTGAENLLGGTVEVVVLGSGDPVSRSFR